MESDSWTRVQARSRKAFSRHDVSFLSSCPPSAADRQVLEGSSPLMKAVIPHLTEQAPSTPDKMVAPR